MSSATNVFPIDSDGRVVFSEDNRMNQFLYFAYYGFLGDKFKIYRNGRKIVGYGDGDGTKLVTDFEDWLLRYVVERR
jgi:hypothetical protein